MFGPLDGRRGALLAVGIGLCLLAGAVLALFATGVIAPGDSAGNGTDAAVTVRYYDDGNGSFGIEYEGGVSEVVELDGDDAWETHTFDLSDATFSAGEGGLTTHGGHDFHIALEGSLIGVSDGDVCFESVTMGTEAATSISPVEGGAGSGSGPGESGTAGNHTPANGSDAESDGGLSGFGAGVAVLALLCGATLSAAWRRRA